MPRARRWPRSASTDVPMIGVAKGPDRDAGNETFYLADKPAVKLPPRDPLLYFIQRLRDEAHRFAIGSHRTRRKKDIREAGLQEIPGIGPTRKRALLHHFGTLESHRARLAQRSGAGAGHQRRDRPQDPRFLPRVGEPLSSHWTPRAITRSNGGRRRGGVHARLRDPQCARAGGGQRRRRRYRLLQGKDRGDRAEARGRFAVATTRRAACAAAGWSRPTSISTSPASSTAARRSRRATIPNHMLRVQAVKPGFTVEDIYNRAKVTLENCIKQGTTRIRTHAEIDLPVGTKCIEALKMLQKEYAWAVDLEICAFAQEGLANVPEADKALVAGARDGRDLDRRRAELRHRPSRPHQPRVRAGAANTTSTSTCTSIPATTRRRWTTCSWPT